MPHHVARVTQAIAESPASFEDALAVGFKRATETLRGIRASNPGTAGIGNG